VEVLTLVPSVKVRGFAFAYWVGRQWPQERKVVLRA
jgi:hypothetical protein